MKRRDSFSAFLPRRRHSRLTNIKSSENETLLDISLDSDETQFRTAKQDGLTSSGTASSCPIGAESQHFSPLARRVTSTPRLFCSKTSEICQQNVKRTKTPLKYNVLRSFSTTTFFDQSFGKKESRRREPGKTISLVGLVSKSSARSKETVENKV